MHTSPFLYVMYSTYMAYMSNLVDLFVSGTYLAMICEVEIVVFGIYIQRCWVHMVRYYCGCVSYICNVQPTSVRSADASGELKGSHFHVVVLGSAVFAIIVASIV